MVIVRPYASVVFIRFDVRPVHASHTPFEICANGKRSTGKSNYKQNKTRNKNKKKTNHSIVSKGLCGPLQSVVFPKLISKIYYTVLWVFFPVSLAKLLPGACTTPLYHNRTTFPLLLIYSHNEIKQNYMRKK